MNDDGVVAAILNRVGSLGAEVGKRSRGELVLEALDHAEAEQAATALTQLNPTAYRSFNLFVGDATRAYWLRHDAEDSESRGIEARPLPEGLSMITAHDRNDVESPRIRDYLSRFAQAPAPDPESGDWQAWSGLMASRVHDPEEGPLAAMTIATDRGFGTSSSALIALPSPPATISDMVEVDSTQPIFLFAPGPPDRTPYAALVETQI